MLLTLMAPLLAACATNSAIPTVKRAAFTSKEFGVSASPRLSRAKNPPRGGGRYLSPKPYKVAGKTYTPVAGPGYVAEGQASWYGMDFHGRQTANGEIFGANYLTGASPVLPIPSYARVTNLDNGRSVVVRFNDRGPYLQGRVADLSYKTAEVLGFANRGSANVQISYVGPAPLKGDDSRMLMASVETTAVPNLGQSDVRVASLYTGRSTAGASRPSGRGPLTGGLVGGIVGMFGYAEAADGDRAINGAIDAANAMATRNPALEDWVASVDEGARAVDCELGVFANRQQARRVAEAFAMLGAVDEEELNVGGGATRLTLTHLKPGVPRADVVSLARQLGLKPISL